ncbi:MAG: hypothetical protein U0232_05425 [Thermomicrobiales bacterium]
MIEVLLDHHLGGYARLFTGAVTATGLETLLPVRFVTFADVMLPFDSTDRTLWRFAQEHKMVILTGNRREDDEDALGRTLSQEGTPTSLPVVTIGHVDRLREPNYRQRCAFKLLEVLLELDTHLGAGRIYIP